MLESFILRWGIVAVGVGTFFEGEAVLVTAGALAHRGLLSLPWVLAAAFVGSVTGDQLWFQLGRRFGRGLLERRRAWNARAATAGTALSRHGSAFVLGFRFLYGLRTVTPVFLGASGYPPKRFAMLNSAGGALWAVLFGGGGWLLGASLEALLRRSIRVEQLILVALVCVLAMWLVVRRVQRNRSRRDGSKDADRSN